jgi:histidine triad (HIT) family protein
MPDPDCVFCSIRDGQVPAHVVLEQPDVLAFLDQRPLFPGHVLVIPRAHYQTVVELPPEQVEPLFQAVHRLAGAVQAAMGADGTLIVINYQVSQSVPHLHVHVVPRRRKDGLRGFLWPRQRYPDDATMAAVAAAIRAALPAV